MHRNFAENDCIREKVMGYYLDGAFSNRTVWDNVISKASRPLYVQHSTYIPQQHTWHDRAYNIYSTEDISMSNHYPECDTLLGHLYIEPTLEALFEAYPQARDIFESAGVDG